MADKEPLWRDMARRHGLRPHGLAEIAGWRFGDFAFHSDYDHISNLTRARQAGWCESLDTGQVLVAAAGFAGLADHPVTALPGMPSAPARLPTHPA